MSSRETTEEKKEFLRRWLQSNPFATVEQARAEVRMRFGETLGTQHLNSVVKEARARLVSRSLKHPTPVALVAVPKPSEVPQISPAKLLVMQLTKFLDDYDGPLDLDDDAVKVQVGQICGMAMTAIGIRCIEIENGTIKLSPV